MAQSGSAPAWGAGGRRFKSCLPDPIKSLDPVFGVGLFLFYVEVFLFYIDAKRASHLLINQDPTLLNMDQPENSTRNAFADDFRRIRESRNVSIADLSRITLVTADILEEFERSALLGHPRFNTVYLKAFVRTLADALNVPKEVAAASLDEMLQGQYSGALKGFINPESVVVRSATSSGAKPQNKPVAPAENVKTLIEAAPKPEVSKEQPTTEKTVAQKTRKTPKTRQENAPNITAPTETPLAQVEPKVVAPPKTLVEAEIPPTPPATKTDSSSESVPLTETEAPKEPIKLTFSPPPVKDPDTTSKAAPKAQPIVFDDTRGIRPPSPPIRSLESDSDGINWFKVLVPLAVVAVLTVFVWFIYSEWKAADGGSLLPTNESVTTDQTTTNTGAATTDTTKPKPASKSALPDSFMVSIVSVDKPISGMKLTPDTKPRFPVWVELGDTLAVKFKNQPVYVRQSLKLEGGLKNARIMVNGKAFAIPGADTLQVATLDREAITKLLGQ